MVALSVMLVRTKKTGPVAECKKYSLSRLQDVVFNTNLTGRSQLWFSRQRQSKYSSFFFFIWRWYFGMSYYEISRKKGKISVSGRPNVELLNSLLSITNFLNIWFRDCSFMLFAGSPQLFFIASNCTGSPSSKMSKI